MQSELSGVFDSSQYAACRTTLLVFRANNCLFVVVLMQIYWSGYAMYIHVSGTHDLPLALCIICE